MSGSKGSSGETLEARMKAMAVRSGGSGDGRVGTRQSVIHDFTRTRPDNIADKTGNSGMPVKLKANFAKVTKTLSSGDMAGVLIYQYHVSFEPQVDSKRIKMQLLEDQAHELGVVKPPIFDGMILYLPRVLKTNKLIVRHPITTEEIVIKLEKTADLIPTDPQCTTFLNVTNRRMQELLGLIQINRHFFDRQQATLVPAHGMEIWPGFNSAIRRYEQDLLMNIDVVHKMLRRDSVLQFLEEKIRSEGPRAKEMAAKELIGTSVLTKYNNKLYRVDDIYWDKHPEDTTFEKRDGTVINLVQYMKEQYDMEVKEKGQPLLLSRAKKRGLDGNANADLLLIPEMCYMTGLTERMRADTRVMKDVATKTRVGPQKRVESAEALCRAINGNRRAQELLKSWDLTVDQELARVTGRILPVETLVFGDNREVRIDPKKAEWSRESKNKKPVDSREFGEGKWALVFPKNIYKQAENFFSTLRGEGQGLGIKVETPILYDLVDDTEGNFVAACIDAVKMKGAQLVLAVVPNDNKQRYDAIKKTCFLECPVACQVVQLSTLKRENILRSICQKILTQMNVKMGGAPWCVKIPMKRLMIVGYDSYTDSSMRGKAVGAAVFNLSDDLSSWYSQAKLHENIHAESQNISTFLQKALVEYKKRNDGDLPQRIFIYRAGVGEGQIPVVYNVELDLVHEAITNVYGAGAEEREEVKLSFIIINKKINTRFFTETGSGRYDNPMPGTVVDTVVTRVERYDFFMVPQSVNQGAVTPVAYNVIYDKSGLSADQMQRLAFKLCHLYYNWQGTIRVPAPVQYAHKLAFLISQSTHAPANEVLNDTLYFL